MTSASADGDKHPKFPNVFSVRCTPGLAVAVSRAANRSMTSAASYVRAALLDRLLGVTYDTVAGTLSVLGQSITLSSLSTQLQSQWANAVATAGSVNGVPTNTLNKPSFGGTNIDEAVGAIMDATPAWRTAITLPPAPGIPSPLAGYLQTQAGGTASPFGTLGETWNRT